MSPCDLTVIGEGVAAGTPVQHAAPQLPETRAALEDAMRDGSATAPAPDDDAGAPGEAG